MTTKVGFEAAKKWAHALAEWTRKYINDLPDSAFAVIVGGGKKEDGKTVPRSLRKFPHHNKSVMDGDDHTTVDLPHLRNALARIDQADVSEPERARAKSHLVRHAKALGVGDQETESDAPSELSHALTMRIVSDMMGFTPPQENQTAAAAVLDSGEETNRLYSVFCHEQAGEVKHSDLFVGSTDGKSAAHYVVLEDGKVRSSGIADGRWLKQETLVASVAGRDDQKVMFKLRGFGKCSVGQKTPNGTELFMAGVPYLGRYFLSSEKLDHNADETPEVFGHIHRGDDPIALAEGRSWLPKSLRAALPAELVYWDGKTGATVRLVKAAEWFRTGGWKKKANEKVTRLVIKELKTLSAVSEKKPFLRVQGTALVEGTWNDLFFPAAELEKAAGGLKGKPMIVEHRYDVSEVIGQIVDTKYNPETKGIDFVAEIDDEATAVQISRGTVRGVSVGLLFNPHLHWTDPEGTHESAVEGYAGAMSKLAELDAKFGKDNITDVSVSAHDLDMFELSVTLDPACPMDQCGIRDVVEVA